MRTSIISFGLLIVAIFIILTVLDDKDNTYAAERRLWFIKKDYQTIYTHAASLPQKTIDNFIKECQNFLESYPHLSLRGQVQDLLNNALILKKAMVVAE